MASRISISPSELEAQSAALSSLSERMANVRKNLGSIGSAAWDASDGGVGSTHILLQVRADISSKVLKVGANLAGEAAQSYTNVDAVIRGHIDSDKNNIFNQYLRNTVPDAARKEPVSTQKVVSPRQESWDTLQNAEGFKEGTYWDGYCGNEYGYTYHSKLRGGDVTIYGSGCAGMARQMQYEMEGRVGDWVGISGPDEIQPGDVLQYYHLDAEGKVIYEGGYPKQHYVYVYDIQGDTIYTGEGNVNGKVAYRTMSKTEFTATGPYDSYRQRLDVVSVNRV